MDPNDLQIADIDIDPDIEAICRIPRVPNAPRDGATLDEFRLALKDSQLALGEARTEIRRLAREVATLRVQLQSKNVPRGQKAPDNADDVEVKLLGKKFCVMGELWVDEAAFRLSRPAMAPNSPDRYSSEATLRLGVTAELYEFVPSKFHDRMLRDPIFGRQFFKAMSEVRSTLVNKIRSHASLIFNLPELQQEVPPQSFLLKHDRAAIPAFQKLLKFDTSVSAYPPFAPILYPNQRYDGKKVFQNPVLPRILQLVLFGLDALEGKPVRAKTNGRIWGVTEITAGAIAWSAIVARYMLSPDTEFNPRGKESGIEYQKDFDKYKKLLITKADTRPIKDLLMWWNVTVFLSDGSSRQNRIPTRDGDGEFIDIDAAMRDLDLDSDLDDDSVEILHTSNRASIVDQHAAVMATSTQVAAPAGGSLPVDIVGISRTLGANDPVSVDSSVGFSATAVQEETRDTRSVRGRGRGRGKGKPTTTATRRGTRSRATQQTIPLPSPPVDLELEEDEDGL